MRGTGGPATVHATTATGTGHQSWKASRTHSHDNGGTSPVVPGTLIPQRWYHSEAGPLTSTAGSPGPGTWTYSDRITDAYSDYSCVM
nr:unnamed protein product [Callosobruchus analis]